MYFYNLIKDLAKNKDLLIFVDMDGVIASYDVGKPYDFANKRPMMNNINIFNKLSTLHNVELQILSICHSNKEVEDKNKWIDKYAPFFKKRNILIRDINSNIKSKDLKTNFIEDYVTNKQIIVVDDDNAVLKEMKKRLKDVILYQDSSLVD